VIVGIEWGFGLNRAKPSLNEGQGSWVLLCKQCSIDQRPHAAGISEHIIVPEADYPISFFFDRLSADRIFWRAVLSTIHFDNEFRAMAGKVRNEVADRHLPSEMMIGEGLSQQAPQAALRIRQLAAQAPRSPDCARWRMMLQRFSPSTAITPP
jgi:hypothetical protein